MSRGLLHHVEVWVEDLALARGPWEWLLTQLGYADFQDWPAGHSWRLGDTYIVVEQSPDVSGPHDRRRAGVNHLAFHAGSRADVDRFAARCGDHGWTLMYGDRHPYAGGTDHYAAYLENAAGFQVELVATSS